MWRGLVHYGLIAIKDQSVLLLEMRIVRYRHWRSLLLLLLDHRAICQWGERLELLLVLRCSLLWLEHSCITKALGRDL